MSKLKLVFFLFCVWVFCLATASVFLLILFVCFVFVSRNVELNASCCDFLQKLSMCLLPQSEAPSESHQQGIQVCTRVLTPSTQYLRQRH